MKEHGICNNANEDESGHCKLEKNVFEQACWFFFIRSSLFSGVCEFNKKRITPLAQHDTEVVHTLRAVSAVAQIDQLI